MKNFFFTNLSFFFIPVNRESKLFSFPIKNKQKQILISQSEFQVSFKRLINIFKV